MSSSGTKFMPENVKAKIVSVTEWHLLGEQLGQPEDQLEKIRLVHGSNVEEARNEMINGWSNGKDANWSKLLVALDNIGYVELANGIRKTLEVGKHIINDHVK